MREGLKSGFLAMAALRLVAYFLLSGCAVAVHSSARDYVARTKPLGEAEDICDYTDLLAEELFRRIQPALQSGQRKKSVEEFKSIVATDSAFDKLQELCDSAGLLNDQFVQEDVLELRDFVAGRGEFASGMSSGVRLGWLRKRLALLRRDAECGGSEFLLGVN